MIDIDDRDVAISKLYNGFVRMTLTVPCINRARHRVFLITGGDKEEHGRIMRESLMALAQPI